MIVASIRLANDAVSEQDCIQDARERAAGNQARAEECA